MHPGFGITRSLLNEYNLILIVIHPFEISTSKVIKDAGIRERDVKNF